MLARGVAIDLKGSREDTAGAHFYSAWGYGRRARYSRCRYVRIQRHIPRSIHGWFSTRISQERTEKLPY
jgi:hypothetical protein